MTDAALGAPLDVLIIGAGLSGIGAAATLRQRLGGKSFEVWEARGASGGTWDLFRYPGVRSDSDMFTLGYAFAPWNDAAVLADGPSILSYVRGVSDSYGVTEKIKLNHRVTRLDWSSKDALWTVEADTPQGVARVRARFIFNCTGYYRYSSGYMPEFPGVDRFKGVLVQPQLWPEDLDYAGKRVVIIGSGATAVTLAPAMSEQAGHVVMLQRSPTYVVSRPSRDAIVGGLARVLPGSWAFALGRWKSIFLQLFFYNYARARPAKVKAEVLRLARKALGPDYPVETHFSPSYDPWDQRVCVVPDNDLFLAVREGRVEMVTDTIKTFTEGGLELSSGRRLEADIVVSATGLVIQLAGGAALSVDGRALQASEHLVYRGIMLSDVPNFALWTGYTNASWTLKCDLTCDYVCRLLAHMDETGRESVTPRVEDPDMTTRPLIDLASGYIDRAGGELPRQGDREPWRLKQNYLADRKLLRKGAIDDPALEFA